MLLAATNNAKKLKEIREILEPLGLGAALRSAGDLGLGAADETGTTFRANALIKALHAYDALARRPDVVCLADDSGLEVDALGGAPGVYSARYAGPDASDGDNNAKLVAALADVPVPERTARYRAVIAVIIPADLAARVPASGLDGVDLAPLATSDGALIAYADGTIEGRIVTRDEGPAGQGGFGYDPYFFYPPAGVTFAELPAAEKHAVSHRGQALARLRPLLEAVLRA